MSETLEDRFSHSAAHLCALLLHTCTDKMADPIILPISACNFAVYVLKKHFLYFNGKEIHKMVIIGSKES